MTILHGEIILFLANRGLQVSRNKGSSTPGENRVDNVRWAGKRGQFRTVHSVPGGTELLEARAVAAPQGQFFAIIDPALLSHCTARINASKKLLDMGLQGRFIWIAGGDVNALGIKAVQEMLVEL